MNVGRKRNFNEEAALSNALKVFWQQGYLGTSLSDLTEAMGINKPSLYAAFGNKEDLFIRAIHSYMEVHSSHSSLELYREGKSLKQRIRNFLIAVATLTSNPELPAGCFMTQCINDAAGESLPPRVSETINQTFESFTSNMEDFFSNEQSLGNIGRQSSPTTLTQLLMTIQFGIAANARTGVSKKELEKVIDQTLLSFDFSEQ